MIYFRLIHSHEIVMMCPMEDGAVPRQGERVVIDGGDFSVISVDYVYTSNSLRTVEVGIHPL